MEKFKKFVKPFFSKTAAYIFFIFAAGAYMFMSNATWTYSWIADLYPLGEKFVPAFLCVTVVCMVFSAIQMILQIVFKEKKPTALKRVLEVLYMICAVFSVIAFIYTLVLLLGLDSGYSAVNIARGLSAVVSDLFLFGFVCALPVALLFCDSAKKIWKIAVTEIVVAALMATPVVLNQTVSSSQNGSKIPVVNMQSENAVLGAKVTYESLKKGEKADAENLLKDSGYWTPQDPARMPEDKTKDINNSYVEIELAKTSTFNTALIEEIGNEVEYFRLQAKVNDEWKTIYQSEKIQSSRLCSFDPVTTDAVRLSIDKFKDSETPAKIKSLSLYNEPKRDASEFEVTAYQRLDGDVPTEILAKGEDYVKNYARFYDVYSTVIVFGAIHWDENGQMNFGDGGEEKFSRELSALKEIITKRSNQEHEVKVIVTTLADGTWQDLENGVNSYMTEHWESIADQTIEFAEKYDIDGVDIDWEYPQTPNDWKVFDNFIARLDDGIQKTKPNAILSGALSSGALGMTEETLDRFDQIQYMAYDGQYEDGYQSSLQQAQEGLQAFVDNGADIKKINIGIAAYGRPVNLSPYWGDWRTLQQANYWDNKYYNVVTGDQLYDGTFCSPALAGDKTAYALFSGAGGVMVFRVACDKTMDDPNSVARGIENTLLRYAENW